jgi:UDP-glucose 4-epimerase
LITGASGFIGTRLVRRLKGAHTVIALSRREVADADVVIAGDFTAADTLRRLGDHDIDAVVHLAAETGGCSEEAGLAVNVSGTTALLRALADQGTARYVVASSIAAAGVLSPQFLPRRLPIPDDHPCDALDAYGLSKALAEEVVFYFHRLYPAYDYTLFRLGAVLPDDAAAVGADGLDEVKLPFTATACIAVTDVVTALQLAVERPRQPGVERLNLVASQARSPLPVPETLARLLGERAAQLDLSHYLSAQTAHDGIFALGRLQERYQWRPAVDVRTMVAAEGS